MKKTLVIAVTLGACAATQLFAQNLKEGVITFSLTDFAQNSVSSSANALNQGGWNSPPTHYKTTQTAVNTKTILQAIGIVLHKNAGFYSSKASLVLVQGELSGFFNQVEELADIGDVTTGAPKDIQSDFITTFADTTLTGGGTVAKLASGRHFLPNPISGAWPVGHHQPWGQIFVKDPAKAPFTKDNPLCENVTFFFSITVEECYDCFYLNSFISDSNFKFVAGSGSGVPCCGVLESLQGSGKDKYYMTLSFDNTQNNPYLRVLNPNTGAANAAWIGGFGQNVDPAAADYNPYLGVVGIDAAALVADGISADLLPYVEPIISSIGRPSPYETRFTLNGIVTYTWTLKLINKSDVVYDFVGTAKYDANGYGFIALRCALLTGSASIAESIKAATQCCAGGMFKSGLWYDWWYGTGWNQAQSAWYAFNPATPDPFGFGSPVNMCADLSFHFGYDEEYEPGEQWDTNPHPDVPLPTPLDNNALGGTHLNNYVPVGP